MCAGLLLLCLTLVTPWTVAHQALLSLGFSRQEYWSGLPCLLHRQKAGEGPPRNQKQPYSFYSSTLNILYHFIYWCCVNVSIEKEWRKSNPDERWEVRGKEVTGRGCHVWQYPLVLKRQYLYAWLDSCHNFSSYDIYTSIHVYIYICIHILMCMWTHRYIYALNCSLQNILWTFTHSVKWQIVESLQGSSCYFR